MSILERNVFGGKLENFSIPLEFCALGSPNVFFFFSLFFVKILERLQNTNILENKLDLVTKIKKKCIYLC